MLEAGQSSTVIGSMARIPVETKVTELYNHTRFDFRGYPPPHPRTQVRFPLMAKDARLLLAGGDVRCRENAGRQSKDPSADFAIKVIE